MKINGHTAEVPTDAVPITDLTGFQLVVAGKVMLTLTDDGQVLPGPAFASMDEASALFLRAVNAIYPAWLYQCLVASLKRYKTRPTSRACLRGLIRVPDTLSDQIVDTVLEQVSQDLLAEMKQIVEDRAAALMPAEPERPTQ